MQTPCRAGCHCSCFVILSPLPPSPTGPALHSSVLPVLFSALPAPSHLSPLVPFRSLLSIVRTLLTTLSLSLSSHFCTVHASLCAFLVDLGCDWPLMIATNHPATQASHTPRHRAPPSSSSPPPRQNPCFASELAKLTTLRSSLLTPPK